MSRVQLNNGVNTNNNNNKILLTDAEICNFIETGLKRIFDAFLTGFDQFFNF